MEFLKFRKINWFQSILIRIFGKKEWWGDPKDPNSALVIVYKNIIFAVPDSEVAKERAKYL